MVRPRATLNLFWLSRFCYASRFRVIRATWPRVNGIRIPSAYPKLENCAFGVSGALFQKSGFSLGQKVRRCIAKLVS